jgi:hypothetical protein
MKILSIIKVLAVASIFFGLQLSANAMVEIIKGSGGKVIQPNGTVTYCPNQSSATCAKIHTGISGNPNYPDLLDVYGPTGGVLETRDVILISIGTDNQSVTVEDGGLHNGGSISPLQINNRTDVERNKK